MTKRRILVLRILLLVVLMGGSSVLGWLAWTIGTENMGSNTQYNFGVEFSREELHYKAMDQFRVAFRVAPFESEVSVYARYNLSALRARERSFEALAESRSLLEDVLRQRPSDEDSRRNLEIVIATMKAQMLNEGMNQESAEEALGASSDSQQYTETPGTGSEYGGGRREEKDY